MLYESAAADDSDIVRDGAGRGGGDEDDGRCNGLRRGQIDAFDAFDASAMRRKPVHRWSGNVIRWSG